MLQRNYDPRPARVRVMEKFTQQPERVWTMRELAEELGIWQKTLSPLVSKIHMYGGPIEKVGHCYWRLKRNSAARREGNLAPAEAAE